MRKQFLLILFPLVIASAAFSQTTAQSVASAMQQPLQNKDVIAWQIRQYVVARVPRLTVPNTAAQWTTEADDLRERALNVIYHGWPKEWVDVPPEFEDLGEIASGKGYRIRKLRYQVVPGFEAVALLYEPETIKGPLPAILDVDGHEPQGKAMEYIQKRCINQALQGILALNLEWIGMGELNAPGNVHYDQAYLDLAGANGLGIMYLEMRRGLDYLWQNPQVDRRRIGITGLSGGGWQTSVLSALDKRIYAALPGAGYVALLTLGGAEWIGDNEQSAADFHSVLGNIQLTAMRAPRPTLLMYNETDSCCFRAPRMKPFLYDGVRPVFALYGAQDNFHWYSNIQPGDHNYQLDNRLQSYRFFTQSFGLPLVTSEQPVDADIKTSAELTVGLPKDNLTLLTLAQQFSSKIQRPPIPAENTARKAWVEKKREQLKEVARYHPVTVNWAWPVANTWGNGLKTIGYRFDLNNGLSAEGTLCQSTLATVSQDPPWTVVIDDKGANDSAALISGRVNRGEQVLALNLLFTGGAAPPDYYYPVYDRMLATIGERSLGLEAAQLIAIVKWLQENTGHTTGRLEVAGMRSQAVALVAAAIDPTLFSHILVRDGLASWIQVFQEPISYLKAPELFCLDLYRYFDLDRLAVMASPARVESVAGPVDTDALCGCAR